MTTQYSTLREKIAAEKAERNERYDRYERIYREAWNAGYTAGVNAEPTPMIVGEETTLFSGKIDTSKPTYFVPEGACGFAWVTVRPGNCGFANWLRKTGKGRKSYYGGMEIWISEHNQSVERKERHAYAMANSLSKALEGEVGSVTAGSRLD
jgi:hypothetical protein